MFNRFYKLSQAAKISGAVLMSALLLWATSGVQVTSQQPSQLPKRDNIIQALSQQFSTLVAGEAPLLLFDQAAFLSDPSATIAVVPRENREFKEKFAAFMDGEIDSVIFGGWYVSDPITVFTDNSPLGLELNPGSYLIKLVRGSQLVAQLIGMNGEAATPQPFIIDNGPNAAFWIGVALVAIGLVVIICSQVCGGR